MAERTRKGLRRPRATAAAKPKEPAPEAQAAAAKTTGPGTALCPRCGTEKFRSEERTRVEGRRTVRTTVLVCERGHTFAKPALKGP